MNVNVNVNGNFFVVADSFCQGMIDNFAQCHCRDCN
jgi:hypothetical protein